MWHGIGTDDRKSIATYSRSPPPKGATTLRWPERFRPNGVTRVLSAAVGDEADRAARA